MEPEEKKEMVLTVREVNRAFGVFEEFLSSQDLYSVCARTGVPRETIELWSKLFHWKERALRWEKLHGEKKQGSTLEARAKAGLAAVIDGYLASLEEARERAKKDGRPAPVHIHKVGEFERLIRLYLQLPGQVADDNKVGKRWNLLFHDVLTYDEEAAKLWSAFKRRMDLFEERLRGGYLPYDDEPSESEV